MASVKQPGLNGRGSKSNGATGASKAAGDAFCDKEVIENQKCYETEHFTLLYNKKELVKGHSLIITKRHALGLLDLNAQEAKELFDILGKVIPVMMGIYNKGEMAYDLKIRSGEFSGRTVNHFHIHIIPRRKVIEGNGVEEYERIYEMSMQNVDRPFLDNIDEDVGRVRRGMGEIASPPAANSEVKGKKEGIDASLLEGAFYESKHFVAMYHPNPVIEGQVLLVPKRNVADLLGLTDEERKDLAAAYAKVMPLLLKQYGNGGRSYITLTQVGGYEKMPTDRLHISLIPRSESDRYSGHDDDMYYDLYEKADQKQVLTKEEIKDEAEMLKRLVRR